MKEEIQKLIEIIERYIGGSELKGYLDSKVDGWYIIAQLRRILLHSGTKIEPQTISEGDQMTIEKLKKENSRLQMELLEAQSEIIKYKEQEISRLKA